MNTVQPIREAKDIRNMKKHLAERGDKYVLLFTLGINTGLRVSDLLKLQVSDVRERDHITITEQKTGKKKRFLLNKPMQKEIKNYIKRNNLEDESYLFASRKGDNKPISRIQAYRVLNAVAAELNIPEIGTHTLRKTFGFHFYKRTHDIALLMSIFNHSAPSITLRYIGITDDTKDDAMRDFFL